MKIIILFLLLFIFSCEDIGTEIYERPYLQDTVISNDTVYIYVVR